MRELKLQRPDLVIGVGGCVASQEGEVQLSNARPLSMWCLVCKPCTACRTCCARGSDSGCAQVGYFLPGNRKIRPSAASAGGRRRGVCLHHGRLLEILHLLRGAPIPVAKSPRPLDDVLVEIAGLAQQGVKKSPCWARTSTPYRGLMHDGRNRRLCPAAGLCARFRRGAHPLHHQPSARIHRPHH